jgi:hypothetical protein
LETAAPLDPAVHALNELRAPATDVYNEDRLASPRWIRADAAKNQLGLALARDHLHGKAALAAHGVEKIVTVHRVTYGAGGDGRDVGGSERLRFGYETRNRFDRSRDGCGGESLCFVNAFAETRCRVFGGERRDLAIAHLGHEQLDRVRPDINDGAAHQEVDNMADGAAQTQGWR